MAKSSSMLSVEKESNSNKPRVGGGDVNAPEDGAGNASPGGSPGRETGGETSGTPGDGPGDDDRDGSDAFAGWAPVLREPTAVLGRVAGFRAGP
mmetsp:Transcript_69478/g.163294  ORF Transcript_69478/g.163294 Transcript_69478/m.163294 type:complete len:94 (+) Transcript_69478:512-793(+)